MQATELELFRHESIPSPKIEQSPQVSSISTPLHLEQTLNQFFPESVEQTQVQKARQILGESAKNITDEQIESFVTKIDYLMNSWLDSFERQLFDGKTLREIAKET